MFEQFKLLRPATVLIFFFGIISIFFSIQNIAFLGLSFDESLFINAAIGKDDTTFIYKKILGIPIMVYPYIGALKSWLYIPIFEFFGVNNYSIRLPMLVLGYINIVLVYKIIIKYFNKLLAVGVTLVLLTDLTFINLHKIDHGPTAIETFFKLSVLLILVPKISNKRYFALFFLLFLGIFNKLNFIWFVNSLFAVKVVYQIANLPRGISIIEKITLFFKGILLPIWYYIFLLIFFLINYTSVSNNSTIGFLELFDQIKFQFLNLILVISNYQYPRYNGIMDRPSVFLLINHYLFLIVIMINIYLIGIKKIKVKDPHFYLLIILITLFFQISLTRLAVSIWHILVLYPFLQIFILNTILILLNILHEKSKFEFSPKYIFSFLLLFWASVNVYTFNDFNKKLKTNCGISLYSPQMNSLINYLNQKDEETVVSIDWGTHPQLLISDNRGKKYIELNKLKSSNMFNLSEIDLNKPNNLLIIENVSSQVAYNFDKTNFNALSNALKQQSLQLISLKDFDNSCGTPVFRVYKVADLKK